MCVIFEDMHQCLILWRKKYIKRLKEEIRRSAGRSKSRREQDLKEYMDKIAEVEAGKTMTKHENAWDAASQIGCEKIKIGEKSYAPFSCVLNKCSNCSDKWKDLVPPKESKCEDMISYVLFGTHQKCSFHGDGNMDIKDGEFFCELCRTMPNDKKKWLKGGYPKVKKQKVRVKVSEKTKDFMKPGGTYEQFL